MPQTLYLFNDDELLKKVRKPEARLEKLLDELSDDNRLVEELYLWALARLPNERERGEALKYLGKNANRRQQAEDLFWALLNYREFLVNY